MKRFKIDADHLAAFTIAILFAIIATVVLSSCDIVKRRNNAWNKFIKYGGKVNCKGDTLWKYDTTYLDGETIIDSFPVPCNCPDIQPGYTNKQLRMFLRHQKDSMNYILKLEKIRAQKMEDSLNGLLKIERQKTKQSKETTKQEKEETKQVDDIEDSKQAESRKYWIWIPFVIILILAIWLIKKTS